MQNRCGPEGYASQGLPRQDRYRLQRHQVRRRCHPPEASRQPIHGEAHQRPHRARPPLPLTRGLPQARQAQLRQATKGQGDWRAPADEAPGRTAPRRAHCQPQGAEAREHHTRTLRDLHLDVDRWLGWIGWQNGIRMVNGVVSRTSRLFSLLHFLTHGKRRYHGADTVVCLNGFE
jgi:hypothetical protein